MAHVHVSRGIWKHLEAVEFLARIVHFCIEYAGVTPASLPTRLYFRRIVYHFFTSFEMGVLSDSQAKQQVERVARREVR